MNKQNLHFFDKEGFNLNFDWNEKNGYWEGSIYLPKISVGLYANTTIYVLENIRGNYWFPVSDSSRKSITFRWDKTNKFVDEFFMFNFDDSYIIKDTSALVYTPNDGPECETLIINRFDEYKIPLDSTKVSKPLPIHIAFSANEKYDGTTYTRTLIMSCGRETIARIRFFAETVEEDERLKVWNTNLGYHITPEDSIIFYKSDIKEPKPDYKLLNEKRKELMLEGSNIYPYIGSYRAIINAIKFFGYDNLGIIEYWKNVNQYDENFGKVYHSSRYSLTKKETLRVGARNIYLPNKDYKKINRIALVYSINQPTGEVDEWELPLMKENFTYTIEEALIKLYALRKKLNKEFMPGSSRIIDIIGEGNYFGIQAITKIHMDFDIQITEKDLYLKFDVEPSRYIYLTDDRYFDRYIIEKMGVEDSDDDSSGSETDSLQFNTIESISELTLDSLEDNHLSKDSISEPSLTNNELCNLYRQYYDDVYVNHIRFDDYLDVDDSFAPASAKIILTNTSFDYQSFGGSEITFGYKLSEIKKVENEDGSCSYVIEQMVDTCKDSSESDSDFDFKHLTFSNADIVHHDTIKWTITMSEDQTDDELKNVGVSKTYDKHSDFSLVKEGTIEEYNQVFIKLPYVGYYDVEITIDGKHSNIKKKSIKVVPYQLELKGFYYDARELPEKIAYDYKADEDMVSVIETALRDMTAWAVTERTAYDIESEFSMPTYTTDGQVINKGPYYTKNICEEWYLADNLTYDIARLIPNIDYSRYIRNGVDVKPYTWFLLGYEYSKVIGKTSPVWTITNNSTGNTVTYSGKYLTFLLKMEGNYTVTLSLIDINGNKYDISRNIFVVSKTANHKIYQTFKRDYDALMEQKKLEETRMYETYYLDYDLT